MVTICMLIFFNRSIDGNDHRQAWTTLSTENTAESEHEPAFELLHDSHARTSNDDDTKTDRRQDLPTHTEPRLRPRTRPPRQS